MEMTQGTSWTTFGRDSFLMEIYMDGLVAHGEKFITCQRHTDFGSKVYVLDSILLRNCYSQLWCAPKLLGFSGLCGFDGLRKSFAKVTREGCWLRDKLLCWVRNRLVYWSSWDPLRDNILGCTNSTHGLTNVLTRGISSMDTCPIPTSLACSSLHLTHFSSRIIR